MSRFWKGKYLKLSITGVCSLLVIFSFSLLFIPGLSAQVGTIVRRLIATQDIQWATGGTGATETFTYVDPKGNTLTLNKLDAAYLKFRTSQDGSPRSVEDLVDGGFDVNLKVKSITAKSGLWVDAGAYGTPSQANLVLADADATAAGIELLIPPGAWPITATMTFTSSAVNFAEGAYLDLTALKDAPIEAMSLAAACNVTVTSHGLQTGNKIRFYGIRQNYVSGATHTDEWMTFNNQIYTVTKIDNDNFTIPENTSTFHAYVPATDPGRSCVPIVIKNIVAGKQKIFNITAPAHVCFADSYTTFISTTDPREQQEVYPEWFGAVGDGATDDLLALNAARNAMVYLDKMQGVLRLSKWYGVSSTFSLNELGHTDHGTAHVEGVGRTVSGFVGLAACAGKPVVEVVGTGGIRFKSFGFTGITPAYSPVPDDAPSVALMLGRSQFNPNAGGNRFEDLGFWGFYQYGVIFNFGSATAQWSHCETNASALTGKANNKWMFTLYNGAGTDALNALSLPAWGAALLPTNSDWRDGTNCSADGNTFSDIYMVANGTKLAGNAIIYLRNVPGVTFYRMGSGGLAAYCIYAEDANFSINDSGGDGYYTIAAAYVASTTATVRTIQIRYFTPVTTSGIIFQTDSNTALTNSTIDTISAGRIILGRGALNSRFTGLNLTTGFHNSGGYLINCFISLPTACAVSPDLIGTGSSNTIIQNGMYADLATTITGNLRVGIPGQTASSKLIVSPYKVEWLAGIPAAGSWTQGSKIYKSNVTSGDPEGWTCILSNTFGTLNSGATTGAIADASPTLVVNSLAGSYPASALKVDDWIDIAGVTEPLRVINVATKTKNIEALSKAAACVVTWTAHGLPDNATITIAGLSAALSPGWDALNAAHVITWIDANSFSIPVDTSGYAAAYDPAADPATYSAYIATLATNSDAAVGPTAAVSFHNLVATDAFKPMANVP